MVIVFGISYINGLKVCYRNENSEIEDQSEDVITCGCVYRCIIGSLRSLIGPSHLSTDPG
jgi:hypothetical protein